MAQAQYWVEVRNDYLGKYRRVTGRTRREVEIKAAEQFQRWGEQETRARERAAMADEKERARLATEAAQSLIESHRSILLATLAVDDKLDWRGMMEAEPYGKPRPTIEQARAIAQVPPKRPIFELIGFKSKRRRLAEQQAASIHMSMVAEWDDMLRKRNDEVTEFRIEYERGDPESVERYISLVLANSYFPEGFKRDCDLFYSAVDKTLIVECSVPTFGEFPKVIEYRYVASRRSIDQKRMKDKESQSLYEDAIIQATLRTVHEIFEGDYAGHCQIVVFNGMIDGVDKATGRDYRACIVTLQSEREAFLEIELARVEPRACFRELRGISGTSLAAMEPVQPIRTFDKTDPRFIEAEGVIDGLAADQNLMTMPWQDFEVLVRDLFSEMAGFRGVEVKVTRTSRDRGVDAVIFDPDPLIGGKSIVQAKRYRQSVPVAAVRELYGTMINEGAGKEILVTTSHFGPSASEFAKDKPITLIDGAHLLHLMHNHGHRVRIDLNEATAEESLLKDAHAPAAVPGDVRRSSPRSPGIAVG